MPNLPLALTTDDLLLDEVLRVAAAVGVDVFASDAGPEASARWATAPLVLVGADVLTRLAVLGLPRRTDVLVLTRASAGDDASVWRGAVGIGAEHVVVLPDGERWLAERLSDLLDASSTPARLVTVVAGRGGAGASTYAVLLARASTADAVLIDLDPLGAGLDARADLRDASGLRWPDLAAVTGRLSSSALRGALPRDGHVAVVSSAGDDPAPVPAEAVAAVLDAAVRGGGLVVVDAARDLGSASRLAWARSDLAVIVVPDDVSGVLASRQMVRAASGGHARPVALVRRGREAGMHPDDIADVLGIPVVAEWRHDRDLARGDAAVLAPSRATRSITAPVLRLLEPLSDGSRAA